MSLVQMHGEGWRALFGRRPSLQLMIGGLLFVVLVLSGIGAVMAWAPSSVEVVGAPVIAVQPPITPLIETPGSHRCTECGIVESRRMIVRYPEVTDRDSTAPVTAVMLSERAEAVYRVAEVTVRMGDGTTRQFDDGNPSSWRPGERMIFIDGVSTTGR